MIEEIKKEYYSDGNLKREYPFNNNGRLHGLCRKWYDNGQLEYEHTYKNGERHKLYREWYKNGSLRFEKYYYEDNECFDKYEFDGKVLEETWEW